MLEPAMRVFYVPTIPYRWFRQAVPLDRGLLRKLFRRFADLIKDNQKQHKCTAVLGLAFSLSLILPGRRRTLNLQTHCLRALPWVSRYAPLSLQLRAILV